jgi:hypothetical protein
MRIPVLKRHRFQSKPTSHSSLNPPPVPIQTHQPFQFKPATGFELVGLQGRSASTARRNFQAACPFQADDKVSVVGVIIRKPMWRRSATGYAICKGAADPWPASILLDLQLKTKMGRTA